MGSEVRFFWEDPIDILLIKAAWEKAFKKKVTDAYWKDLWNWRFVNNPLADRTDAAYIISWDDVASFVAFSPLYIRQGNLRIKAALGNIGFTHPDHQGKGLYSRIYNALIDKMISEKYQMLIGFDNHNSHYPEVKYLGWKDINVLNYFSAELGSLPQQSDTSSGLSISHMPLSDDNIQAVYDCFSKLKKTHIERSHSYLEWRVRDNPKYDYKLIVISDGFGAMYVIYKEFEGKEIDIMEMIHADQRLVVGNNLLPALHYWRDLGYQKVNLWSNLFSEEHLQLEKLGFREAGFSTYFVHRKLAGDFDVSSARNWHVRFLDSDVF